MQSITLKTLTQPPFKFGLAFSFICGGKHEVFCENEQKTRFTGFEIKEI